MVTLRFELHLNARSADEIKVADFNRFPLYKHGVVTPI